MSDNMTSVTIKRILNLPIENQKTAEINFDFSMELSENFHHILIDDDIKLQSKNDFADQINANNIQINKKYQCHTLWVIDDTDKEYTIYNFSYWLIQSASKWYVQLCFDGILKGRHLKVDLQEQEFDRIESEVRYDKKINIRRSYDTIKSTIKPIYVHTGKLFSSNNGASDDMFDHKLKITLVGKRPKTFKEFEKILWRLSEFAFLCCEDMLFYDMLTVFIDGNPYALKYYLRANNTKQRKSDLRTNNFRCRTFCGESFNEDNFTEFLRFREDSDFIFDVFRTTVYSNSFREDYPLRLSQTLEGLANYLGIVDTTRSGTFRTTIHLSLYCNDFIKCYLPTFNKIKEFCDKITKHRNKFSHVKADGDYLQEAENEEFAEILYTTIRVLIIKRLEGEI